MVEQATATKADCISRILANDANYSDPRKHLGYGTAGFRAKATLLDRACFRVGLAVAIRAKSHGKVSGVMMTASHNHHADNGVKIIEPDGSMLAPQWEPILELLVNTKDLGGFMRDELSMVKSSVEGFPSEDVLFNVDASETSAHVYLAMDTRESSPRLIAAVKAGLDCLGVPYTDFDLLSTPQLHYLVAHHEQIGKACCREDAAEFYIDNFSEAFIDFMRVLSEDEERVENSKYETKMVLDCANGVGAIPMVSIVDRIKDYVEIELVNTATDQQKLLNEGCGAEYVHKDVKLPTGVTEDSPSKVACFDGDADRLIYFRNVDGKPIVIDGDKQFALLMMYVVELLQKLGIGHQVSHCLVNTAYANSQAIQFIKDKGITTVMVPTGVKNAHPVVQQYVIGANDEPNGHGTICVKWDLLEAALKGKEYTTEAMKLTSFLKITNLYVGDAIANLLMCEAVLMDRDFDVAQFSAMYDEFPNKMFKAVVANRNGFRTQPDESRLIDPLPLQDAIDAACAEVDGGRAFVRPSGTEDILRLYVEAGNQGDVGVLAGAILDKIQLDFKDYKKKPDEGSSYCRCQ